MCHNLSQPEEVDLAFSEMDATERAQIALQSEFEQFDKTDQHLWHCGYISPYRAAYMMRH